MASHLQPNFFPTRLRRKNSQRGSALIIALILAALIALTLGSLLSLNLTSSRLSKRSLHNYAALNLGEAGLEEGAWSINRSVVKDPAAWTSWTQESGAAWRKFSDFDFGQQTPGWVKVYIDNTTLTGAITPKVVALASVNPPGQPPVTKMIEASLRRRSYFASALVAKEGLVFNGATTSFDSWNSDPDHDSATPAVDYSSGGRTDSGTVATASSTPGAMVINHAQIWGYVATGEHTPVPTVSPLGSIRGSTTPVGMRIDSSRISGDFNAEFVTIAMPTDGTFIASVGATLGTAGTTTRWRCPGIALAGLDTLTIQGDVTLIITAAPGTTGISVVGKASIIIPAGSKLTVYLESDLQIAGNGIGNGNVEPGMCAIWGTSTSPTAQDFQIAGNGALRSVVYAPNGDVKVNGNGDVMGSIVAKSITFVGNAKFHYDESLADGNAGEPFGIGKWRELTTAADRSLYLDRFKGW